MFSSSKTKTSIPLAVFKLPGVWKKRDNGLIITKSKYFTGTVGRMNQGAKIVFS